MTKIITVEAPTGAVAGVIPHQFSRVLQSEHSANWKMDQLLVAFRAAVLALDPSIKQVWVLRDEEALGDLNRLVGVMFEREGAGKATIRTQNAA